jgi:putative glutamine amidotransferase
VSEARSRPLVGITTSEVRQAHSVSRTPQSEPPRRELALGVLYPGAVEEAGGAPVVVPPLGVESVDSVLDSLDGLCLSGGPDLDPAAYGETAHPNVGPTEPDADRFELALTRAAWERGTPILAICRGAQALNVARGGTLIQHLPDVEGTLAHRQSEPGDMPAHQVELDPESLAAEVLGATNLAVNTYHHQAIRELGAGLRAVAWAPDGVIEVVEAADHPFCIGVQWHAEAMSARPADRRLFRAFVEAAARAGAVATGKRQVA